MKTPPEVNAQAVASVPDDKAVSDGLAIREYMATLALQGILANPQYNHDNEGELVKVAVRMADALLDTLNFKPTATATPSKKSK